MTAITLNVKPLASMTDEAFRQLCAANPDAKLERTANGELVIMSPTGGESGRRNRKITQWLGNWTDLDGTGEAFDSSTMFQLPNGALRSPDASWVSAERWNALTEEERRTFPPLCPDFVIELRSSTDTLNPLQTKMQEYLDNGLTLGWLIDPQNQQVEIYRQDNAKEIVHNPTELRGEGKLESFVMNLRDIF